MSMIQLKFLSTYKLPIFKVFLDYYFEMSWAYRKVSLVQNLFPSKSLESKLLTHCPNNVCSPV